MVVVRYFLEVDMSNRVAYIEGMTDTAQRLYDAYSTIMSEKSLSNVLDDILGESRYSYPQTSARDLINRIVLGSYPNEATIKANFINGVLLPQSPKTVSIFELPIGKSRVDMCKVNGHSAAYEIKTDLDTFCRLEGQLRDYFDVFETVYVVTSEVRWKELPEYVPEACGIYSYRQRSDGSYTFCARRRATKSAKLDSEKQLSVIPKQQLCSLFRMDGKGISKQELVHECLEGYGSDDINLRFKRYLKRRYGGCWDRFRQLQPEIFEIDYQWFYRHGLSPQLVY